MPRSFKLHLPTGDEIKSDWTIIPDSWKLLSNQMSRHISFSVIDLSKNCISWCFKDALDHHHHHFYPPFAKCSFCCEKGHFIPIFLCLLFVLFLYFVHDSSAVLMKKMRKKLEQKVKSDTKRPTQGSYVWVTTVKWLTNKEAMGLFLHAVFLFVLEEDFNLCNLIIKIAGG